MRTCTLEDTMKKLKVKEAETEFFVIGSETSSQLEISEGDILLAKNSFNGKCIAGEAKIDQSLDGKTVLMNRFVLELTGLDEGSKLVISRHEEEIKKPIEATFKVEEREKLGRKPLTFIEEKEEEFIDFVKNRIWTEDSKFLWEEEKLKISIDELGVEIERDEVFDFDRLEEFNLVSNESDSYSVVLLIDLSGSMETEDLAIEETDSLMEEIYKNVDSQRVTEFIAILEEKVEIKRSQAATIYVLAYLIQEIAEGLGDKMSVVLFSDEASVVLFEDRKYFAMDVCDVDSASENIIEDIKYHPRGRTNISDALNGAVETMKDFDHEEKKMIVLLTDGEPHPPSIDDKETVMKVIEDRLAPRRDVVINTIGLGDQVDHHLLDKIASNTGGEYTYVKDLQGLIETSSRYADSISQRTLRP